MKTQSIQVVAILGALAAACGEGVDPAVDTGERRARALLGGETLDTFERPAIGWLCDSFGNACFCTATLVDPRYVLTAAHCFGNGTGPTAGTFKMTTTSGMPITPTPSYDFAYSIGPNVPAGDDVAFLRLTAPVPPATVAPIPIASTLPGNAEVVTAFGFGCTSGERTNDGGIRYVGGGFKQAMTYNSQSTSINCDGDSGGPRVFGAANGSGAIWGVNSGWQDVGFGWEDVVANAPYNATPGLRGVLKFGATTIGNPARADFASSAAQSGVKAVTGRFSSNNDAFTDVALVGGSGWNTIAIAVSDGLGGFTFDNVWVGSGFPGFAAHARSAVAGDFDHNGFTDIALLGGAGWNTIPIAFRQNNGTFTVANVQYSQNATFATYSQQFGAKALGGDFDGDGWADDIALVGGSGWNTVPVAFSMLDGRFDVRNTQSPMAAQMASYAQQANVTPLAGNFDGVGSTDIALTGNSSWNTLPVGFTNGTGGFTVVHNLNVSNFPYWASRPNVKLVAADFDGDGDDDIAATGNSAWITIPFALSRRDGNWDPANMPINYPNMPFNSWGASARFVLAGRLDSDQYADMILTGASGWGSIPIARFKP